MIEHGKILLLNKAALMCGEDRNGVSVIEDHLPVRTSDNRDIENSARNLTDRNKSHAALPNLTSKHAIDRNGCLARACIDRGETLEEYTFGNVEAAWAMLDY